MNLEKLRDINYCDEEYQKRQRSPKPDKKEVSSFEPPPTNVTQQNCPCDCRTCGKKKNELNAKAEKFLDETLIDTIIDTIFPQILTLSENEPRSKRSVKTSQDETIVDSIFETFFPQNIIPSETLPRLKRSISTARSNKVNPLSEDVNVKDDASTQSPSGIVEIKDGALRYNVSSPNQPSAKRPHSKKLMGLEFKDNVFILYSAQIPGKIH